MTDKELYILDTVRTQLDEEGYVYPFLYLYDRNEQDIAYFLEREWPQMTAHVLLFLGPVRAAAILDGFTSEYAAGAVAEALLTANPKDSSLTHFIDERLSWMGAALKRPSDSGVSSSDFQKAPLAPEEFLVKVLAHANRGEHFTDIVFAAARRISSVVEKRLVVGLAAQPPRPVPLQIADLSRLSSKALALLIVEASSSHGIDQVALAFKRADPALQDLIGRTLSADEMQALEEKMAPPHPLAEVKAAEEQLLDTLQTLLSRREVTLPAAPVSVPTRTRPPLESGLLRFRSSLFD